jgi:hypothetical protein
MKEIETSNLSHVCGGAGRATPSASASSAGSLNPFTYWTNVWTNAMTAPLLYAPPFSTTPLFPTPFH